MGVAPRGQRPEYAKWLAENPTYLNYLLRLPGYEADWRSSSGRYISWTDGKFPLIGKAIRWPLRNSPLALLELIRKLLPEA